MGISFNGATQSTDHDGEPVRTRTDDKKNVESDGASGGFGRTLEGGSPPGSRSVLIQVIEGEIIPRLFLAHRQRLRQRAYSCYPDVWKDALGDDEVFAGLFLVGDTADIVNRLQSLLDRGIPRERVYVDILAPVARTLGVFWDEGRCSFDDMARGLACVDRVVQEMSRYRRTPHANPH